MQHEYLAFMSKKTNLRKNTIISLSDQNEAELRKISKEKDQILKTFEQRKEGYISFVKCVICLN